MEKQENTQVEETQKKNHQNREKRENKKGDRKDGDKKKGEKKQRESKYDFNRDNVTLETEVPAVPKKHDQVSKPEESKMEKKREELQKKIDELFEQKRHFIENLVLKQKENRDTKQQGSVALRSTLKDQQDKKKELEDAFEAIKAEFETKKNKIDLLYDESQKIRRKMKNCEEKEKLEEMIADRREQLENDILNGQQEAKLIKEIDNLERALPLAEKLHPIEQEIKTLAKDKKELGNKMYEALNVLKKAKEEVKNTYGDLDELKKMSEKSRESIEPIIQQKKEELNDQIQALREQQKKIFSDYKDQQRKYYEEQDLIRYVEWLKRQKENMRRIENRKKKEEERLAREKEREEEERLEQEKLDAINPYQKDIDLCEQLINLCKAELHKHQSQGEEAKKEAERITLDDKQLEKEKITYVKSRRENTDEDFLAGNKKNKKQKKQFKKEETNKPQELKLGFSDMSDFSQVKVTAPRYLEDLQKTLDQLQEKKTYFENLPKPEKKEAEEKEVQQKQSKRKQVEVDNEEDYPTL